MASELQRTDASSLIAQIASKSGRGVEDVRAVLARHGVAYKPSIAVPKRLCILSLAFTGERKGERAPGPISFTWDDLGPGLTAILSDRNFRGKSTLLAMLRWCLNGRRGDGVPSEMADWFHTVTMRFTLDGHLYEVDIADAVASAGTLWRMDDKSRQAQASFSTEDDFEAVMSAFFMDQLGLQMMVTHIERQGKGIDQPHDWVWLSGAMVIEPSPSVLFGTGTYAGLGSRMMQMYLGVPWTNAASDVAAAQNRIKTDTREASVALERTRDRRLGRIAELDAEIRDLRKKLDALPKPEDQRAALRAANRAFADAQARERLALRMLTKVDEDVEAAKEAYAAARRDLVDFKDGRAAKRVFRSLDPVCCPRCDEVFDEDRRVATSESHTCVVCRSNEEPEGDPAAQEAVLKKAVADAEVEAKAQKARHASVGQALKDVRAEVADAERDCSRIESALAQPSPAAALQLEIVRKEAQKEELDAEAVAVPAPVDDQAVLKFAEQVTKDAYKPLQDELLAEVSDLIREYAVRFGVESLESADLKGNTNLFLVKDGGKTSFSKQTDGERVRLKVATTLAIIKVAERRGLGRHPGLLLIDSPGANEMVGRDYANLIAGLAEIAKEIPHLQVFVASINNETIRAHVPRDRVQYAEGDDYLW